MDDNFKAAFDRFMVAAQERITDHWKRMGYTHAPAPTLEYSEGQRWIAVYRVERGQRGSIHAFIDLIGGPHLKTMNKPGDILKPATFKAPAKHARGNIFAEDAGKSCMNEHGPEYLARGRPAATAD